MLTFTEQYLIRLLKAINSAFDCRSLASVDDVGPDIDAIVNAFRLQEVRRYFHQVYWWDETDAAVTADAIEPGLKLENVAAHSWHVADVVLLLSDRFEPLCSNRALRLAILHDKLEMYTGDFDPVGPNGNGNDTHAFDAVARARKTRLEREALAKYLNGLRPPVRDAQRILIEESLQASTREARFVKAIDKLQALAFVHEKKRGYISDNHIAFSIRYTLRAVELFPEISAHYLCLADRFVRRIADHRDADPCALLEHIARNTLSVRGSLGGELWQELGSR